MKGRIKMFNEDRGFGFIIGEDEKDYFFHISEVKSMEPANRGAIVEFTPSSGSKGPVAKSIYVTTAAVSSKKSFIALGDVRIKVSNIKNYGISSIKCEVEKTRDMTDSEEAADMVLNAIVAPANFLFRIANKGDSKTQKKYTEIETEHYLYVTTYQNDNYTFYQSKVNFDIFEKCKELDQLV